MAWRDPARCGLHGDCHIMRAQMSGCRQGSRPVRHMHTDGNTIFSVFAEHFMITPNLWFYVTCLAFVENALDPYISLSNVVFLLFCWCWGSVCQLLKFHHFMVWWQEIFTLNLNCYFSLIHLIWVILDGVTAQTGSIPPTTLSWVVGWC